MVTSILPAVTLPPIRWLGLLAWLLVLVDAGGFGLADLRCCLVERAA